MRFLVDESAGSRLSSHLTALGHDATFVAHTRGQGIPDEEVLAIAHAEGRVLITQDRDFGDLIFRQHHRHSGVIYLRLGTSSFTARRERLDYVLDNYADQLDRFIVVTQNTIRVR